MSNSLNFFPISYPFPGCNVNNCLIKGLFLFFLQIFMIFKTFNDDDMVTVKVRIYSPPFFLPYNLVHVLTNLSYCPVSITHI